MLIPRIASGSRGDIQPYGALATGLQAAGHTVRFVTHQNFAGPLGGMLRLMAQMAKAAEAQAMRFTAVARDAVPARWQ